ncbi:helix-turn-helix domain-containing protein [Actinoplanes sp. TRM 88003]|uniref:Helix-turn-helix domain-containing protein n=1 Tax=Paractinoplanes aksuensis TaxID=2939490 RepID=A0ABT1DHT7_9ACTN|nr:helix-turn-helix domain-containing protein [Actinoplanes aksuensis]MCO8270399.1 helix-turn-helix domain-containing protein [Actinoplanes aksuensis]
MSGRRLDVLRTLQESGGPLSIGEIARRLGVHVNTARFHLDALTATGQVELVESEPSGPGRPPLMYRAHRGMDPAGPRNYRFLADILTAELAEAPDPAAAAAAIGRRWGVRSTVPPPRSMTTAQSVAWLVRMLGELGFEPEAGRGEISLRNCPFLDVVEPHNRVTCALHLGFMQGAAEQAGAALEVTDLIPFVSPYRCQVNYRPSSSS